MLLSDSFPFEEPTLCFRPFVTVVAGSPGSLMALGIATGKKEEVVTLIFSGNVNKGQRIRVGVDAEALALHDFQTLVFLKFFFSKLSVGERAIYADRQDKRYLG